MVLRPVCITTLFGQNRMVGKDLANGCDDLLFGFKIRFGYQIDIAFFPDPDEITEIFPEDLATPIGGGSPNAIDLIQVHWDRYLQYRLIECQTILPERTIK